MSPKILVIIASVLGVTLVQSCTRTANPPVLKKDSAYTPADPALFDTIARYDSLLFVAFNTKNLNRLVTFFSDDLEVYQDNTGKRTYKESMEAFHELFKKEYTLKRDLLKNSLEIYPVKDYGAIETGRHTFSHTENGKLQSATFKFVHIWKLQDGQWKITRLITYDH